ncbi:hypothetical protein [Streptomyces mirabilis]|uniref:hypothetical protein n=1 Tax=Streptomyces mirabilis TaxID=68239 RepID=UPI0036E36E71
MNETYAFIEAMKTTHGVAFLCRLLKVARSSFYAWLASAKTRAARQTADEALAHTARAEVFAFIETFYSRRLRKHKVFGYLTPAETRQRHQHALAT